MKKLIVLGLLLALAGVVTGSAGADDTTPATPAAPQTPAPTPPEPPAAPETPAPETPAPETPAPETPAPETPAPETPAPETPAPATPAPETPAPGTPPPATPAAPTTPGTPATPETPAAPGTPTPKATKPVEQQLNGRVVAFDRAGKNITIQVNNQTYVLQISEETKFVKAGKDKGIDDLIVGEEVTVTVALRESPSGRIEIVVVAIDLPQGTEAQGGGSSTPDAKIPPFVSLPNPANVGGQVRSPSN